VLEETELFKVHPMCGQAHGDRFSSLDETIDSGGQAEDWAVFGVMHRSY